MKKTYSSPRLVQYGTVNELTQATENSAAPDFFTVGGVPVGSGLGGSSDVEIGVGNP